MRSMTTTNARPPANLSASKKIRRVATHPAARAAGRLTPRMAAYQAKRLVRNTVVPRAADRYDRKIRAAAAELPPPTSCERIPMELATFVGAFYVHADDEMRAAAHGQFTILGRTVDFGSIPQIDWRHRLSDESDHHLWRMKLAQLEVLHSLVASGDPAHHETATALLDSFTNFRNFASSDAFAIGWSPYGASHRLLASLSGLSIAAHGGCIATDVRAQLEAFAQLDAGFVGQNIEHDLRNNHTERNLAALCLYHYAAESISRVRAKWLDREVNRIIRSTVLADGMQIERSAMYQGLTVMSLRIFAACPVLSGATRELARERADTAARAWLFLTHKDGGIALFNDSWLGETPAPAAVLDVEVVVPPAALPQAGYFRLAAGTVEAIFDAGEIGPRWNPGHGHADFLALEIDVAGHRLIVDPGTSQYSTGERRAYERSAASHNGPRYRSVEPVEYSGCFKVGKLSQAKSLPSAVLGQLAAGAIGGETRTAAGLCRRVVCALPSGGLLVVDYWNSPRPVGVTHLLVSSDWRVETVSRSVLRASTDGAETRLTVYEGGIDAIDTAAWSRRYLQLEQAVSIVLKAADGAAGTQRLAFGIGVERSSEVPAILGQAMALLGR